MSAVLDKAIERAQVAIEYAKNCNLALPSRERMLRWAERLEQGDLHQGRGRLKRTWNEPVASTQYCCLGVFAEQDGLFNSELPSPLEGGAIEHGILADVRVGGPGMIVSYLPTAVMTFNLQLVFTDLNDDARASFGTIASVIRAIAPLLDSESV